MAPRAALVTVGDELLYGETVDTNAAWLGRELARLGLTVVRRYTVGDDASDIQEALRAAMADTEVVICSGGLGPTRDDVTKAAVADLLGLEIHTDRALLARLEERFRSWGYDKLPAPNVCQAEVPDGARTLTNAHGTAPGLVLEQGDCQLVLLPGVPRELRGIFDDALSELLRARFGTALEPVRHRLIHTTGIAESRLAEVVDPLLEEHGGGGPDERAVSLAFLPDVRGVDLRLSVRGGTAEEADVALDGMERLLEPVIGEWRFDAQTGDVAEALNTALKEAGWTVAVAESCTGGLVAARITDHPGASTVMKGGVVTYSNEAKVALLGVSEAELEAHGAVSEAVVRRMAAGVRSRFGADAGIAITGVAGPGGGSEEKPVGTVWLGWALKERMETRCMRVPGDRHAVRERATQAALAGLLRMIVKGET